MNIEFDSNLIVLFIIFLLSIIITTNRNGKRSDNFRLNAYEFLYSIIFCEIIYVALKIYLLYNIFMNVDFF